MESITHLPEQVKPKEHRPGVVMEAQGSLFEIRRTDCPAPRGGIRGKVRSFSKASRRRLIKRLARLQGDACEGTLMITLTFHEMWPCDGGKACLWAFRRALFRLFGNVGCFWRKEIQERGAPHFHLLVFRRPGQAWLMSKREIYSAVRRMWAQAVFLYLSEETRELVERDCGLTNVRILRTFRQVMRYVSKYVAKVDEGTSSEASLPDSLNAGTSISESGNEDFEVCGSCGSVSGNSVLDNGAYLAKQDSSTGRWWGVWNPVLLPWGELFRDESEFGRWFFMVRRSARRLYSRIPNIQGEFKQVSGFTLLCEQPSQMMVYGLRCQVS